MDGQAMTTSRSKAIGSEAERRIAALLGGVRVGMDGGPVDVIVGDYLAVQVKSLRTPPSLSAVIGMLEQIPVTPINPPLRAVVVQTRPGGGKRSVRTITFLLDEWATWHATPDTVDISGYLQADREIVREDDHALRKQLGLPIRDSEKEEPA